MDFIVNERSLHGQFHNIQALQAALQLMLDLKGRIERSRRTLRCPRGLREARVGPEMSLLQALNSLPKRELRNALVTWVANKGPFWDDEPLHSGGDWFEVRGDVVTGTGLAEVAQGLLQGLQRAALSFAPSDWMYTPIPIEHVRDDAHRQTLALGNHWELRSIEKCLSETHAPLRSWNDLVEWARQQCPNLVLSKDVIRPLDGHPFILGAAERLQVLLSTLDRLKSSFDPTGALSREGVQLQQEHFVGGKAWFTDSSDSEKNEFRNELTFPHPEFPDEKIFCPWHGKVKIAQMRMHFTHPIRHDRPLYVVYIGPKITKR